MNYIWDLIVKAEESGLPKKEIHFSAAKSCSPYMELSTEMINAQAVEDHVEINPLYRFSAIFQGLLDVNHTQDAELKRSLFDIVVHFLADIDLMQGMNKKEYYIRFVLRDLEEGRFGHRVQERIRLCSKQEKDIIARNILRLYETGEAIHLLKDTMRHLFPHSIIYANCEEKDELLIYVGQEQSELALAKIELINDIFLPVRFHTEIYWQHHFGLIEVGETMRMDRIALY